MLSLKVSTRTPQFQCPVTASVYLLFDISYNYALY